MPVLKFGPTLCVFGKKRNMGCDYLELQNKTLGDASG